MTNPRCPWQLGEHVPTSLTVTGKPDAIDIGCGCGFKETVGTWSERAPAGWCVDNWNSLMSAAKELINVHQNTAYALMDKSESLGELYCLPRFDATIRGVKFMCEVVEYDFCHGHHKFKLTRPLSLLSYLSSYNGQGLFTLISEVSGEPLCRGQLFKFDFEKCVFHEVI